ncbi:MAG: hypothetical protein CL910_05835 [Deltaproteobacteria bacterium]|jgi:thiol-disulfide isomerase/thioredoxin|nr:hypothetical protein [Deltaproteobacteria bacterium]
MALVKTVGPVGALLAGLGLALLLGCGEVGDGLGTEGREAAPSFSLASLTGGDVTLESLGGRPAIIDFWATWCAPCIRQIPVLNALQDRNEGRVSVVGIAVDASGAEVVAPFADEHGIDYTVLIGDEGLAQRFGALGFPTLFVLDPTGGIVESHVGVASLEELEEALERAGG